MAIEIESKFLVTSSSFKELAEAHTIKQGYICSEEDRVVRVRVYDQKAYITIKNATVGFARNEFEYPIPVSDAELMLNCVCQQPIIDKTRYVLNYQGHVWEVDECHGGDEGLIVAEIELERADETFELPPFVGSEVTNDSRYYNACLFKHPYTSWE